MLPQQLLSRSHHRPLLPDLLLRRLRVKLPLHLLLVLALLLLRLAALLERAGTVL
jgi:hypothetical protein